MEHGARSKEVERYRLRGHKECRKRPKADAECKAAENRRHRIIAVALRVVYGKSGLLVAHLIIKGASKDRFENESNMISIEKFF